MGHGQFDTKEDELQAAWPSGRSASAHVDSPRVFADPSGRIIAWILPSIIPSRYQVRYCSHFQHMHC